MNMIKRALFNFLLVIIVALTGCSSTANDRPSVNDNAALGQATTVKLETPVNSVVAVQTQTPAGSPTPDLRLPAEEWMDWPIVPEVSARAREIYQAGINGGNDPHAFSKIGDCQSIPASFMGIYDMHRYSFTSDVQYLQETVDYFSGSFNRQGESVRGGFNAPAVLLPFWANAEVCQRGETPMECENRIHNPSIVFISLEVWFEGRTPDVYENYLRKIIEYNIAQGTLPILATKADNVEGNHSINYTVAKLAREYDIPMWNFWRAVQPLPNHGLNQSDPTGFHLNLAGWNTRSFTALQVLDAVRRAVENLPAAAEASSSAASTQVVSEPDFSEQPIQGLPYTQIKSLSSEAPASLPFIMLSLAARTDQNVQSAGIFKGGLDGNLWTKLSDPGTILLDDSAAGILAAQGSRLYLVANQQSLLLTDKLQQVSSQPAVWLADGRAAAIIQTDEGYKIGILNPADGNLSFLPAASEEPSTLYPSRESGVVYWGSGECSPAECSISSIFRSGLDGPDPQLLPFNGMPAFAVDGKMAFLQTDAKNKNQLSVVTEAGERLFPLYGNRLVDAAWSPDGSTLAISVSQVSDYSGRVLYSWLFLFSPPYSLNAVLNFPDEAIEKQAWSPDGTSILIVRRPTKGDYELSFVTFDIASRKENKGLGFSLTSEAFAFPQRIFWLP